MDQITANATVWRRGAHVDVYANRVLAPVEVIILARYREQLSGRVIEVGCGAGRVLGYLVQLATEAHGLDLSEAMVDYCRRAYPDARVRVGDAGRLSPQADGTFDAIVAANNLIDVFDDAARRAVLAQWASCLTPGGLLIFSSHNLAELRRPGPADGASGVGRLSGLAAAALRKSPAELAAVLRRLPARARNRRRLGPLQQTTADWAIVNDDTFDYGLLHYYVNRDAQERQLRDAGLELIECLDPDARPVPAGADGAGPWLHYVARPAEGR